jgi:dihydroorotate dehydrogenase
MPDWSYRTVLRPVLGALPSRVGRDLALGAMGVLGRAWAGRALIDLLGHMRAPEGLRVAVTGLTFPSPMGIGAGLDPELRATSALARFGAGFIEVGPVVPVARRGGVVSRDDGDHSLIVADPPDGLDAGAAAVRLAGTHAPGIVLLARLDVSALGDGAAAVAAVEAAMATLAPRVHGFTVAGGEAASSAQHWRDLARAARVAADATARALFLVVPPDLAASDLARRIEGGRGLTGFAVDGALRRDGRRILGRPAREAAIATVRAIRAACGTATPILAAGGIHEPQDALALLSAGADLIAIDSGLVFGGPGLPKRVNDALAAHPTPESLGRFGREMAADPSIDSGVVGGRMADGGWFWTLAMGAGMSIGSVMALAIAWTRVVLPYDEQFVGMTRHQLAAVNPRLLPFLTHDRVTLAGAMVAIAALYIGLSWFGSRRGRHWAHAAIVASAVVGFASFFLFLGFGYFDPFHAFVTAILFQLLLLGIHGRLPPVTDLPPPMLVEDRAWRLGLWGQLGLVVQAVGFVGAGLIIAAIGATEVFVREDLEFLGATAESLAAAGHHLVPLVAHDRATLGGMLLAVGVALLLTVLWGFRPGERWLWWTLLLAGTPGYAAAIGVHYAVGYQSAFHLAPAFLGLGLFAAALAAAYPSLCRR